MQVVPLQAMPNQTVQANLNGQNTQLNIYQKSTGLFMDVLLDNTLIIGGVLCENLHLIIISEYLGYQGDFMFVDNEGSFDPEYTGLGSRFSLIYISPDELPAGVF